MKKRIEKILEEIKPNEHFNEIENVHLNYLLNFTSPNNIKSIYPKINSKGMISLDHLLQEQNIPKENAFFEALSNHVHRKRPFKKTNEKDLSLRIASSQIADIIKNKKGIFSADDLYDLKGLITLEYFNSFYTYKPSKSIEDNLQHLKERFLRDHNKYLQRNRRKFEKVLNAHKKKKQYYKTIDQVSKIEQDSIILDDKDLQKETSHFLYFLTDELEEKAFEIGLGIVARKGMYAIGSIATAFALTPNPFPETISEPFQELIYQPMTEMCSYLTPYSALISDITLSLVAGYLLHKFIKKDY